MALRAASSLMSYTGPGGCNHSRPTIAGDDGLETAAPDWILECGPCEASLAGHELWGPATEPAPLTVDEIRLRDAQHADATRNLWAGLAQMPDQLAALALQNQATLALIGRAMGVDFSTGLPQIPVGTLGGAPAGGPAVTPPPGPPAQNSVPSTPASEPTRAQKAAATRAAKKAAAAPDAG
jgi:hypothetical protein